jgi:hypothetical protein
MPQLIIQGCLSRFSSITQNRLCRAILGNAKQAAYYYINVWLSLAYAGPETGIKRASYTHTPTQTHFCTHTPLKPGNEISDHINNW